MNENIEVSGGGLQCDNPKCDWKDESIAHADFKDWLNKPCPKCGENVLTQEDLYNAEVLDFAVSMVNSMSEEELKAFVGDADIEQLKTHPMFAKAVGLDTLDKDGAVTMTVSSHEQIIVEEIKKVDES